MDVPLPATLGFWGIPYAISNSKVMPFKVKKQQTQKLRTIQSAQYIPIRPIDIIHLRIDLELWFWVANKIIRNEYFHLPLDPKTIYTKVIKPLKYGCQQPQRFAGLWGSCIGTPWNHAKRVFSTPFSSEVRISSTPTGTSVISTPYIPTIPW